LIFGFFNFPTFDSGALNPFFPLNETLLLRRGVPLCFNVKVRRMLHARQPGFTHPAEKKVLIFKFPCRRTWPLR
jgi:hypothetical protein